LKRLLILLFFCYSSFNTYSAKPTCLQSHCIAVIDAGSSGSRLHVYAYDLDKTNTPIAINEIWNRKVLPGLSTIEHEHGSVSAYMEKLFTDAPAVLMPVYFYSTAGMRLLPKSYHSNVNQLVSDWFDKQYYWRLVTARTITGKEEGVYAWLSTNYKLNLLDQGAEPTSGIMDIGGASVQIVFSINNELNVDSNDIVSIDLYGHHFKLFSRSFLGLGQNEMGHQYADTSQCYPVDYELPGGLAGKGDANSCKNEITKLVNKVHYVKKNVSSILNQNPIVKWYVLGGVTYLLNDKLFAFPNQQFTNDELLSKSNKRICTETWSKLEQNNPNNFMIYNYCMLPAYLSALLVEGYGIKPNQNIHFMPANKAIDWTIGVVLQHHNT